MTPRAGERDVQVVAPGAHRILALRAAARVDADPVAEAALLALELAAGELARRAERSAIADALSRDAVRAPAGRQPRRRPRRPVRSCASRQYSGAGPSTRQRRHSPSLRGSMPSPSSSTQRRPFAPGSRAVAIQRRLRARAGRGAALEQAVDGAGAAAPLRLAIARARCRWPRDDGRLVEHAERRPVLDEVPVLVGRLRRLAPAPATAARRCATRAEPRSPLGGRCASER